MHQGDCDTAEAQSRKGDLGYCGSGSSVQSGGYKKGSIAITLIEPIALCNYLSGLPFPQAKNTPAQHCVHRTSGVWPERRAWGGWGIHNRICGSSGCV